MAHKAVPVGISEALPSCMFEAVGNRPCESPGSSKTWGGRRLNQGIARQVSALVTGRERHRASAWGEKEEV